MTIDPLAGSAWSAPTTVAGFSQSPPNATLMQFAEGELSRLGGTGRLLDLGCGARNALPLARMGWDVFGVDLSWPMLVAARNRALEEQLAAALHVALAPMHAVPAQNRSFDLVIAHGIWNLARSAAEFRAAVREGARMAKPRAALFVFTFSRSTLPPDAEPIAGEPFVFTQFSGQPQCFLTEDQLVSELGGAGFTPDWRVPLRELHRRPQGALRGEGPPVIFEGAFRFAD